MTPSTQLLAAPEFPIQPLLPAELAAAQGAVTPWLWHGYLAPGKITAFISPPKTGKTTLATLLLARIAHGGQLAGHDVAPARALVVSEESTADWDVRCRRFALGEHVRFVCRPFRGARPTEPKWHAFLASLETLHRQDPFDLLILDALAALLPGYAETSAPKLLDCLLPLQDLAHHGPAVWLLHHPTKRGRLDGQAARGSGALSGFADIVMEMTCYRRPRSPDRRRRLCAYSRYQETPRHLILELTPEADDYLVTVVPSPLDTGERGRGEGTRLQAWPQIEAILTDTTHKLTQKEIRECWPEDEPPPDRTTLSKWLKRAAQEDLIRRSGTGIRHDHYRYWLPTNEPYLYPGPTAPKEELQAWNTRLNERMLQHLMNLTTTPTLSPANPTP